VIEVFEVPSAAARLSAASAASVGDYVEILKPRVVSLVVFTALIGLVLAPGHLHPVLGVVALLCIAIGAGAAGALNMWYERDIDRLMRRTAGRPLPGGRMMPGEALGFGAVLGVGAVVIMGLAVNYVAAALLALTIGFYVFVRDYLLLDPAALLGVVAVSGRRLCRSRGADVAGCRWSPRNQAPNVALYLGAVAGCPRSVGAGGCRRALCCWRAFAQRRIHGLGDPCLPRHNR
jgi:UbiA prenyltransferase family